MFLLVVFTYSYLTFLILNALFQSFLSIKNTSPFQTKGIKYGGEFLMTQTCFYCTNEMDKNEVHNVTFHVTNMERDERLCDECYQEWLQGIKG